MQRFNLNPNILNTILSYIKPHNLTSFFLYHHIKFTTRFIYNTNKYNMSVKSINNAFIHFPNITISHITIHALRYPTTDHHHNKNDIQDITIPTTSILRLTLTSRQEGMCNPRQKSTLPEYLAKFPNLISLTLNGTGICTNNLNLINCCPNLRTITITNCSCHKTNTYTTQNFSINHTNIQKIKLSKFIIYPDITNFINNCTKLISLRFNSCTIPHTFSLTQKETNLQKFSANFCTTQNNLHFLLNCSSLKHLNIHLMYDLTNLHGIENMTEIKYITIHRCNNLANIETLTHVYPRVKRIKISNCMLLHSIPKLGGNYAKISVIHCGEDYR